MGFELTDEQKDLKDMIRKFVSKECPRDVVMGLDGREEFPGGMIKKVAGMDLCGLAIDEEYGGVGRSILGAVIVAEEISTIYPVLAGAFVSPTLCGGKNISDLGSNDQKKKYLPGLARGSLFFTCGLSEPGTGFSGLSSIRTTALRDGGKFILNGAKTFVRLADTADYMLTLARTEESGDDKKGLSFFIVDMKTPGISVNKIEKTGFNGFGLGEVTLFNVCVPEEDLLGGVEKINLGWDQLATVQESDHLEVAACSLGIAQGAYDYAANYAGERVQFGKAIVEFEAVRHMLVDMAMDIQSVRLLTYRAAWLADQGRPCLLEAAMARAHASETAKKAALQCLQIFGGYGYAMEYDAQRYVRDSLTLMGGGVTLEVLKNSIGGLLGLNNATA